MSNLLSIDEFDRAKNFKLDEIRRILEILSTNRVKNEEEVIRLSQLLVQADISSSNEGYEHLMDRVRNYAQWHHEDTE